VNQLTDDGIMALFGAPIADEDLRGARATRPYTWPTSSGAAPKSSSANARREAIVAPRLDARAEPGQIQVEQVCHGEALTSHRSGI